MRDFIDSFLPGLTLGVLGLVIMDIAGITDSKTQLHHLYEAAKTLIKESGLL